MMDEDRLYGGLGRWRYVEGMKFDFPPRAAHRVSAIRPGFDVLLAVTAARQAASPTARLVATRRGRARDAGDAACRTGLLASGRVGGDTPGVARFADVSLGAAPERDNQEAGREEMNSPFTTAFQPLVKHGALKRPLTVARSNGDGTEME